MSGIVIELSAMLVETTIFHFKKKVIIFRQVKTINIPIYFTLMWFWFYKSLSLLINLNLTV